MHFKINLSPFFEKEIRIERGKIFSDKIGILRQKERKRNIIFGFSITIHSRLETINLVVFKTNNESRVTK